MSRKAWTKIFNVEFSDNKQSNLMIDGERVGYIDRDRYAQFASWDSWCCKCGDRIAEDCGDIAEARRIVEDHCGACSG